MFPPSPLTHPTLRDDLPRYPPLIQTLRITATTVPGPSGIAQLAGSSFVGPTLYVAFTQQKRTDSLLPRDREPCLVNDINGRGLSPGFYTGRLSGTHNSLPVYDVSHGLSSTGGQGGSGVSSLTVEEVDGSPSVTGVGTLRFDQTDGFVISQVSAGIARVDLNLAASGGSNVPPYDISSFRVIDSTGPTWQTAHYFQSPGIATTAVTNFIGADYLQLVPFVVPITWVINRLAVYVGTTSVAHNIRIGIFGPSGPGTGNGTMQGAFPLVVDGGAINLAVGGWRSVTVANTTLSGGNVYWLGSIMDSVAAGPTLGAYAGSGLLPIGYDETDGLNGLVGYYEARAYGALPALMVVEGHLLRTTPTAIPAVFLRFAP